MRVTRLPTGLLHPRSGALSERVEMKRSIIRVMALLATGGLVLLVGPAAAPSLAAGTVGGGGPGSLTAFFVVGDQSFRGGD